MEITLPLLNLSLYDNRLSDELKKDFVYKCRIKIQPFEEDWVSDECQHAFGVWIEYGEDNNHAFLFEADLNDLEMFAYSLIKRIEIVRRDYSEVIKDKIKNGRNL
jgi:hypothetical protein